MRKIFIISFLILGCASHLKEKKDLTVNNFRSLIEFEITTNYFSGKYNGSKNGCFPINVTNTCFNYLKNSYELELDKKLDVKKLEVKISNKEVNYIGGSRDLLYLVAGEISLQLGYKYMMYFEEQSYVGCSGQAVAKTSYKNIGDSITSTTKFSSDKSCLSNQKFSFLLFNDYKDITNGIVSVSYGMIRPFISIYGGGENLRKHKKVFFETGSYSNDSSLFHSVKIGAWKKYLKTKTLVEGLYKKLSIENKGFSYNIKKNEKELPVKLELNPIDEATISED